MGENEDLVADLKEALGVALARFIEIETMPYPGAPDIAMRRIARAAREELLAAIDKANAALSAV